MGQSFRDVWSDSEKALHEVLLDVARTGGDSRFEGYSPDTQRYLHALVFRPLPFWVVAIFLDMTQWKLAEEELDRRKKRLLDYRRELYRLAAELSVPTEASAEKQPEKLHERLDRSFVGLLKELRSLAGIAYGSAEWEAIKDRVARTLSDVEALLQDTRALTLDRNFSLLRETSLELALHALAEKMLKPHGVALEFSENGPEVDFSFNCRAMVYQMVQELLLNVVRHARATEVTLRVQRGWKRVRILVEDDGCGFQVDKVQNWGKWSGMGLFGVRERLHSLGGKLRILTDKGEGCSIWMTVPVTLLHPGSAEKTDPDDA